MIERAHEVGLIGNQAETGVDYGNTATNNDYIILIYHNLFICNHHCFYGKNFLPPVDHVLYERSADTGPGTVAFLNGR